jgi:hypothetical protein
MVREVSMGNKYLICILTNRRIDYFITVFLHLHAALKCSNTLRNQCKIIIACSPGNKRNIERYVKRFTKKYNGLYDIDIITGNSYLEKINLIFQKYPTNSYEYFVKHDDDVLVSSHTWITFLSNSPEVLASTDNLLTTINLSTGIPSCSFFVNQFLNEDEKSELNNIMFKSKIPDNIWGNDYSRINKYLDSLLSWDENGYWEQMNLLEYSYKGLHPVRTSLPCIVKLNSIVLERYDKFQSFLVSDKIFNSSDRYLCNNIFLMKYERYKEIINDKSLFVDCFDEVPINRYRESNSLNFCFFKESLGIHIAYNTAYRQEVTICGKSMSGKEVENHFLLCYLDKISKYFSKNGDKEVPELNGCYLGFLKICNRISNR